MSSKKRKTIVANARRSRNSPAGWLPIATQNSTGQSFKMRKDPAIATKEQIYNVIRAMEQGNNKIRVSQAYAGTGHTFGLERRPDSLRVYDFSEDKILGDGRFTDQYDKLILEVADHFRLPLSFEPRVAQSFRDPGCDADTGVCVYYFDKYFP